MVANARELAALPLETFGELLAQAEPEHVLPLLRGRLRYNLPEFCRCCWPTTEDEPGRFDLPFNDLHRALFELGDVPGWRERKGTPNVRTAVAAPRGYAKSTIVSFAQVAHDIVYGLERFIVLISAGRDLALDLSRDLLAEFQQEPGEKPTPFQRLYGPFEVEGSVEKGWRVRARGGPWCAVLPKSFGTRVRGIKFRGIRPTKILIDDGEDPDRVRNPDQRLIWWNKLHKDVGKLGARDGGTVLTVVGTILHPDSMLANLMNRPGWHSQLWKAIIEWPERTDLWERCKAYWSDLTLGEARRDAARAFFEANRAEMEQGAVLLDPGSRDLFELYEILWSEGLSSFLQELQNDPVDPSAQIFYSESFARFTVETGPQGLVLVVGGEKPRRVLVKDLRLTLRWDPAKGSQTGDYAAIAVLGRDEHGYTYVLDVWLKRAKPSVQLEVAWTLAERWGVRRGIVEGNGFQDLVAEPYMRQREERRNEGRFWMLQIEPETTSTNKELRIATLEPDVSCGWILFGPTVPQLLFDQFDHFPTGDHDDGPDVVHGGWRDLGGSPVRMEQRAA